MSIIAVKNWERFQHYKDRDPPWIKLYRDVLTSESWVLGTDASRLVQIAITLLAARYQNATPNNFSLIKKVCSLDCSKNEFDKAIVHLTQMNFLEIQQLPSESKVVAHLASNTLATCPSDARLQEAEQSRAETEAEQRGGASRPATYLSADFELTEARMAVAITHRLDPKLTFDNFTSYWKAASGQKARKRNWDAAWSYWCGNQFSKPNGSGRVQPRIPKTADQIEAEEAARAQH